MVSLSVGSTWLIYKNSIKAMQHQGLASQYCPSWSGSMWTWPRIQRWELVERLSSFRGWLQIQKGNLGVFRRSQV